MNSRIDEIAPDLFRISVYLGRADLQFNQFLVRDEEPLLYHTGLRTLFPLVRQEVARVLDPATLRWIGFSHFEADECGALNDWLALAPRAQPLCGTVGAMININDFADRRARVLADNDILATGRRRFRYLDTPHVPHGWDSGLLFEETAGTLFCSDLFLQSGDGEPVTETDILEAARRTLLQVEAGPLAHSYPGLEPATAILPRLSRLQPRLLAVMHGTSYAGDGAQALEGWSSVLRSALSAE